MARLSRKKINPELNQKIQQLFYQLIADLKNPQEVEIFLKDFLNKPELELLTKRLAIAYFLSQNQSYQDIKKNLAVSSTTIASVLRKIKHRGYQLALKKIQTDQWADRWVKRIGQIMKFAKK
ncbi:MAG: Trp family transcriptional regulator [Microgenomates group bacterium]